MLKRGLLNQPQTRVTLTYQNLIFCHSHEEKQGIGSLLGLINMANLDDTSKPSRHFTNSLWAFWPMCGQFNNPRWKNVKALTLLGLAAVDIRVLAISNVGSIQSKIYINTYVTLQFVGSQWQNSSYSKVFFRNGPIITPELVQGSSTQLAMTVFPRTGMQSKVGLSRNTNNISFPEIFRTLCREKVKLQRPWNRIQFAHISVESMITCAFICSSLNIQYKTTSSFQGKTDSTSKEHYWSTHPIDTENCPQSRSPHINCEYSSKSEECLIDEPPRSP